MLHQSDYALRRCEQCDREQLANRGQAVFRHAGCIRCEGCQSVYQTEIYQQPSDGLL